MRQTDETDRRKLETLFWGSELFVKMFVTAVKVQSRTPDDNRRYSSLHLEMQTLALTY